MTRIRRFSAQTLSVLAELAEAGADWRYGLELTAATGLQSGSLYPILARLAERGLLESKWQEPSSPGRPPRHAYRLTAAGKAALRASRAAPISLPGKEALS